MNFDLPQSKATFFCFSLNRDCLSTEWAKSPSAVKLQHICPLIFSEHRLIWSDVLVHISIQVGD
jgi:hypothetical protein